MLLHVLFSFVLIASVYGAHDTTCTEDQTHFADVCFKPTALKSFDIGWFLDTQPEQGWYAELGNDIARLHMAEILHAKLLTLTDNFDKSCYRVNAWLGEEGLEANTTGFDNLHGKWDCRLSKDNLGVFLCDAVSDGPSKYHENFTIYPVYSDAKNFLLGVVCFPNGQAGWTTLAATPKLTDAEKAIVKEQVNKLGFVYDDAVTGYGEECPK